MIKSISFDALRNGKKYYLVNYGDRIEFEVEQILANGDFKVKDLVTLERFLLMDLIRFGKGQDFELRELE
jgi:hypothetical protein